MTAGEQIEFAVGWGSNQYYGADSTGLAAMITRQGATVVAVATGADNLPRMLWRLSNGAAQIWTLTSDGTSKTNSITHGPYPCWTPQAITAGYDNTPYLTQVASY